MPTLRIMSVYEDRKRMFATELSLARTELGQFEASLHARYGNNLADAMLKKPFQVEDLRLGKVPDLSKDGSVAARTWQTLDLQVRAIQKRIRTPDCWFRESPGVVSVLGMTGLSWRNVHEKCDENGRLPISGVLWLLEVLRATEPTTEQARTWTTVGGEPIRPSSKWRRRLDHRHRRLVRLLHTAVMLEEDVRWEYRM